MSRELNINSNIYIPKNKILIKNENETKTNFSDNEDISEDSEYINNLKYKNIFISDIDDSSNNISRTNSFTDNNTNQNNFKFSIDLPNVSKSRLHEYLNNDLIESLEKISPEISRKETKKDIPKFQLSEPESDNNNKNEDEKNEKENNINYSDEKNNIHNNNFNSLYQNNFLNNLNQFNNNLFFNNLQIDNNGIIKNNTFMNNIENNNNNNNNKKIFKIREGDWNCFNCNNLNFSFRTKCNRCGMTKIISMKKFNKLNNQQNTILNNNYFNKYVYNQEINNINFINL
jgi:hypothetical protein